MSAAAVVATHPGSVTTGIRRSVSMRQRVCWKRLANAIPKYSSYAPHSLNSGGVSNGGFVNVLCETVIMHLDRENIAPSVSKLLDLLEVGGTLYLSWRVTEGSDRRDEQGRLYAAFDPSLVTSALSGANILLDEQKVSESSGKMIRRLVARRK